MRFDTAPELPVPGQRNDEWRSKSGRVPARRAAKWFQRQHTWGTGRHRWSLPLSGGTASR